VPKRAKLFSVDEANALVPRLALLMSRLQRAALDLRTEMEALAATSGRDPATVQTEELLRHRPPARALVEQIDAIVAEIEESGAELKDVHLGLVDFPTEVDGERLLLCWQYGEPEVAFWHRVADGFAGRRPLPGSRPTPSLQ